MRAAPHCVLPSRKLLTKSLGPSRIFFLIVRNILREGGGRRGKMLFLVVAVLQTAVGPPVLRICSMSCHTQMALMLQAVQKSHMQRLQHHRFTRPATRRVPTRFQTDQTHGATARGMRLGSHRQAWSCQSEPQRPECSLACRLRASGDLEPRGAQAAAAWGRARKRRIAAGHVGTGVHGMWPGRRRG